MQTAVNNDNSTVLTEFDQEAQRIQTLKDQIAQQEHELEQKRLLAEEAERQRKLDAYNGLREDAAGFRATAAKETDEASKKMYVQWALDADKQAVQVARELGLAIEDSADDSPEPTTLQKVHGLFRHRLGAVIQTVLLGVAIFWASTNFDSIGKHINELNKSLPVEQQMNAYDLTSNQKFFFEKYVEFWDLPVGLFKLLILVPFVGLYMLPFIRSRKDFFTEFFEDLTPYQRCLITLAFVALFILHSALSHGVKP
ncbi:MULTISPECIES: hypothetical protein [unclassified Spirosoma]|uniref:hypothetical protein n=1 Tax=unclassified Spirosoma TaxID=2621999 RepID=UPI000964F894|nr:MULTISPECIES: hypothetical protein [unclassified Spirosoma]MBN8820769.1 hypothetical protein [Spirosoma sp.]OJW76361.1 MAG: hypothetical protein BGO59_22845 [Spirosoma sp. 48-14]